MVKQIYISNEQKAYWPVMNILEKAALLLLIITFGIYITGAVKSHIELCELPNYWHMSLDEYLQAANQSTGWSWTKLLHKSDYLNFLPIALLASITFICYLRILPLYIKDKDKWYVIIVIAQLIILVLAASGVLV